MLRIDPPLPQPSFLQLQESHRHYSSKCSFIRRTLAFHRLQTRTPAPGSLSHFLWAGVKEGPRALRAQSKSPNDQPPHSFLSLITAGWVKRASKNALGKIHKFHAHRLTAPLLIPLESLRTNHLTIPVSFYVLITWSPELPNHSSPVFLIPIILTAVR